MAVVEKVLVYLGPSLSLSKAREILLHGIYRPPAKQGDILSDVVNLNPTHVILVDGCFRDNLSPWHKEIIYALQYHGVKAVYGSSSMGALRASELDFVGMIGVGKVYEWYRDGVTEDDAEVALNYAEREARDGPVYYPLTVPLCDIRAGMLAYQEQYKDQPVAAESRRFFEAMQKVHYMDRTRKTCEQFWGGRFDGVPFPYLPQKETDAIQVLKDFRGLKPEPKAKPMPEHLSLYFQALYDRDRKIIIKGHSIAQQHIDSYVMLHNPEYERIAWDSANQELALMLCDLLCVDIEAPEIDAENFRFWQRSEIDTPEQFEQMLLSNGWTRGEYERLIIQNARIRKLQHAASVAKTWRRNTRSVLDYLRTHQAFDYWVLQVADLERRIKQNGAEDWLGVDLDKTAFVSLGEHFEREGMDLKMTQEDFLLETGFSNQMELAVALERIKAGKEK